MTEAAKEARRAYDREYRRTHREQIKENNRRYWERKAARLAQQNGGKENGTTEKN